CQRIAGRRPRLRCIAGLIKTPIRGRQDTGFSPIRQRRYGVDPDAWWRSPGRPALAPVIAVEEATLSGSGEDPTISHRKRRRPLESPLCDSRPDGTRAGVVRSVETGRPSREEVIRAERTTT